MGRMAAIFLLHFHTVYQMKPQNITCQSPIQFSGCIKICKDLQLWNKSAFLTLLLVAVSYLDHY